MITGGITKHPVFLHGKEVVTIQWNEPHIMRKLSTAGRIPIFATSEERMFANPTTTAFTPEPAADVSPMVHIRVTGMVKYVGCT